MANPHADIGALSVRRDAAVDLIRPPRRWLSRVVLPLALLIGFAGLFAWSSWDYIVPATPVTVASVRFSDSTPESTGQELFKANGWIEPRPLAVDVAVQTNGMYRVEEVHAIAGDHVKAGQLLVRLDDTKPKLDLDASQKRLEKRKAGLKAMQADQTKAEVALNNAIAAIDLARQEAKAELTAVEAELSKVEKALEAAELAVKIEEELRKSGVIASDVKLQQAKLQRDVAQAEIRATVAKIDKTKTLSAVRVRQFELARATAEADLGAYRARVSEVEAEIGEAMVAVNHAKLELDRTRIMAPCEGVVMQLNVRTGTIMGGQSSATEHRDVAVVLYDPNKLQVLVEVPVAKFGLVRNGQPAVIELDDVLPGLKIPATVLADTHLANKARNSVPVKVALPEPPPIVLRPDMIASVRFLALPSETKTPKEQVRRLIVPRKLVRFDGDKASVWIVSHRNRAEMRTLEVPPGTQNSTSEVVEVIGQLQPTDRIIVSGQDQLRSGQRVKVTGEES